MAATGPSMSADVVFVITKINISYMYSTAIIGGGSPYNGETLCYKLLIGRLQLTTVAFYKTIYRPKD